MLYHVGRHELLGKGLQDFIPGQRWVSSAELDLGLGTVINVEHRTVTLAFPATGDTRIYARHTAPLSRVRFAPGDTLLDAGHRALRVTEVHERQGTLSYTGVDEQGRTVTLAEGELNDFMQLDRPGERLFSAQVDSDSLFELRHASWQHRHRLLASDLYGLTGCRTSLIPHQLYIAHEVGARYAPRVLLADEVGLGKTIEAGLILHQQLLSERAERVLIVVPESLVHQWLVEMLRRFNLLFSLFDAERCEASGDDSADNPFHSQQLVLCSLEFLAGDAHRFEQALAGEWDLLVVDEAHHLQWSPDKASHEYRQIERLAARTAGVLLLTATPEQLGRAGHFARLRLLDSNRFPNLDSFLAEENAYEPVARAVQALLEDTVPDAGACATLRATLPDADSLEQLDALEHNPPDSDAYRAARQALVEQLLDRHGTGRMLFRNTRSAVKGFPARQLHPHPLPIPEAYAQGGEDEARPATAQDMQRLLCPERRYSEDRPHTPWTQFDPRLPWLSDTLQRLKPDKVLVITASARTAIELADALYARNGLHAALFHEKLSLVERDRAAAFFADPQAGTQVLICSEIGSEGRNFQFAHHLVLFDLPLDPDLLEQRIGRLDRIGQTQTIHIHVPYLEHSAQAALFLWYDAGLTAFTRTSPTGSQVYREQRAALWRHLTEPQRDAQALIATAAARVAELEKALHNGRDRLLEYNSCRQPAARILCERAEDLENAGILSSYLDQLFDAFGINSRLHSAECLVLTPGEHMLQPVPGLPEDGLTVTFDRATALAFEDTQYLSWEHPLVRDCMDMLLGTEQGNSAVTTVRDTGLQPGTLLLECLYVIESSHRELKANRHFPPTPLRVVLDENHQRRDTPLSPGFLAANGVGVDADTARRIIQARESQLRDLLTACATHAARAAPALIARAGEEGRHILQTEIDRLRALAKLNPSVRNDEIVFFEQQLALIGRLANAAEPRLDAVRVIVAT